MSREFHDGRDDGLVPLESLDVRRATDLSGLLADMSKTAFGGRNLGEALAVLQAMAADPDCIIVVTVSGAMTVAKMGRVLCEMIENGLAHVVVSTGAIMAHGLSEAIGGVHYKVDPSVPDDQLYQWGYNRVFDTLEMEANLNDAYENISRVLEDLDWSEPVCSWRINRAIGERLLAEDQMPSILGCAARHDVPVYVPAFTDSELGLDVATHFLAAAGAAAKADDPQGLFAAAVPPFNPFLDLLDYAGRAQTARRLGIFTVGGGVPRNWAQQVGPLVDVANSRLGTELAVPRFHYGVRICPEPVHWGGLSGCTYSEGVSWGKFVSRDEGGRFAEVFSDATIAWPILLRAYFDSQASSDESRRS
jgi:deoxyhypusine synthase